MAIYDSADLLARLKAKLKRPATDEDLLDPAAYILLQEGQTYWVEQIATHFRSQMLTRELMTTADGGLTYTLSADPLGNVEIMSGLSGSPLSPSADWGDGDFVAEGRTIRFPFGRVRTFAAGPYAFYVKAPGLLDAATQPTLQPARARLLIVAHAAIIYCTNGGFRDPTPFKVEEQAIWCGDPALAGDTGILGSLKRQYFNSGAVASVRDDRGWWQNSPDFGVGRP
jgi:hypothetical protein